MRGWCSSDQSSAAISFTSLIFCCCPSLSTTTVYDAVCSRILSFHSTLCWARTCHCVISKFIRFMLRFPVSLNLDLGLPWRQNSLFSSRARITYIVKFEVTYDCVLVLFYFPTACELSVLLNLERFSIELLCPITSEAMQQHNGPLRSQLFKGRIT